MGHDERLHFHALEKEVATHSSVLAWRIPGKGEPGGLPSMGLHSRTRLKRLSSSSSDLSLLFGSFSTYFYLFSFSLLKVLNFFFTCISISMTRINMFYTDGWGVYCVSVLLCCLLFVLILRHVVFSRCLWLNQGSSFQLIPFRWMFVQDWLFIANEDLFWTSSSCLLHLQNGVIVLKPYSLREDLSSVSSVTQSCPTLCELMDCSTPGLPVRHQLPEFTQTHVHWVGDTIQPSHPLSSPSPAFNLSQHQGLFKWVSSSYQVKYWSFSCED